MIILRLLLLLAALSIVFSAAVYFATGSRRYLDLAWKILRFVLTALLVLGAVLVLERYVLSGWSVLL
jgi:hypothetical protein